MTAKTKKQRHERLLAAGFFPPELPSCFYSHSWPGRRTTLLKSFSQLPQKNGNPHYYYFKSEKASFNFPRFSRQDRRHSYINPISFFFLSYVLAENFVELRKVARASRISITPFAFDWSGDRALMRPAFDTRNRLQSSLNARFEILCEADLSAFYHSIYTHSIAWAIHGKARAKKKKDFSLVGNLIDLLVRNSQDGQTLGIPVGPDTSRIIGEIVGSAVDSVFQKKLKIPARSKAHPTAVRFVDDYTFGCTSTADAEKTLATVRNAIHAFELELNNEKTGIKRAAPFVSPAWREYLRDLQPPKGCSSADIKRFFYNVEIVARDNPNADVVKYALKIATARFLDLEDWSIVQDYLLSAYRRSATVLPQMVEIAVLRQLSRKDVDTDLFAAFVNARIPTLIDLQKNGEVIWLLFLALCLNLSLADATVERTLEVDDGAIALLIADAKRVGLVSARMSFARWNSFLTNEGLNGPMWLYAYESALKGLNGKSSQAHVTNHDYFKHMFAAGVHFYRSGSFHMNAHEILSARRMEILRRALFEASVEKQDSEDIAGIDDLELDEDLEAKVDDFYS